MKTSTKNILTSFVALLVFGILELIAGLAINSISIITNSLKNIILSFILWLSYFFERKSEKKRNYKHTFGYRRYSLLGALVVSLAFLETAFIIVKNAITRIINPEPIDTTLMIVVSVMGVIITFLIKKITNHGKTINEEAANLFIAESLYTWIGLFFGSIIINATSLFVIDPLISLVITVVIFFKVFEHIIEITNIFLQKVPDEYNIKEIRENLIKIDKVIDIIDIHLWATDNIYTNFTAHVKVEENITKKDYIKIKKMIKKQLFKIGIENTTLEFQYESEKNV